MPLSSRCRNGKGGSEIEARYTAWEEVTEDHPVSLLHRRLIKGEKALVAKIRLEKGCVVPVHSHESEQIAIMLSGKAQWTVGAEAKQVLMTDGSVMVLPSGVPHGLTVLEDSVIIDVLSPVGPMGVDSIAAQNRSVGTNSD